jgi:hypothetical protein
VFSIKNQILPWKMRVNFLQKTRQIQFKSEYQVERGSGTWKDEYSTAEIGKTGPTKQLNSIL